MSKASTLISIGARPVDDLEKDAAAHATRFTKELGVWIKKQMPALMSDTEFAQVSAALMIALSRKIAECAVAFGETHDVPPDQVIATVL